MIIAEVKWIKIPYPISIQRNIDNFFHLYPEDFAERLERCKKNLQILKKNPKSNEVQLKGELSNVIAVGDSSSTYILTDFEIEINQSVDELYHHIREKFYPFIVILSFLLMKIIFIKRIFIFKKNITIFQFKRYLQISYEDILEQYDASLIQGPNKELNQLNYYLPLLLFQTYNRQDYLHVIEDYLEAKLRNVSIEVQIIRYWNALEHLSEIFWKNRGKNKLLTDKKYAHFKKDIETFTDTIVKEDIVFPNTTPLRVKELINSKINNYPGIKDEIFEMCRKIKLDLTQHNYEDYIKRIYWIRNELFHRGPPLRELVVGYRTKFGLANFTLKDLSKEILIFGVIIEKIFLKLLGFMPTYLYLEENDQINYKLHWKPIRVSKAYTTSRVQRVNHLFSVSLRSFSLEVDKLKLFHLESQKEYLSYNTKYIALITFVCLRLFSLIDDELHPQVPIKGKLETPLGSLDVEVAFGDFLDRTLDGRYFAYTNNQNEIRWWMGCKGSHFKSEKSPQYLEFYLEFEFLSTSNIYNAKSITKFTSKKEFIGTFETFIIDIKNF